MVKVQSKKPRKQRRALQKVKNHQVSKLFTAPLAESLQEVYGIKRLPVRVGDSVRIIKGEFVGIEGKVNSLNKKTRKLIIEEATQQKRSGENYFVPISVSNVLITKFETEKADKKMDPWRETRMIERKEKLDLLDESLAPKKQTDGVK